MHILNVTVRDGIVSVSGLRRSVVVGSAGVLSSSSWMARPAIGYGWWLMVHGFRGWSGVERPNVKTETVLSNRITRNRKVPSPKDSAMKPLGQ